MQSAWGALVRIGDADIDFEALTIDGPSGHHTIEPMVMRALKVLTDYQGEVVTRETLIDQVWGVGFGGDERLSRAISLLRKALGDVRGQHSCIQTIPRKGYKLIAKVEPAESIAENPAIRSVQDHETSLANEPSDRTRYSSKIQTTLWGQIQTKSPTFIWPHVRKRIKFPLIVLGIFALIFTGWLIWVNFSQVSQVNRKQHIYAGLNKIKNYTEKNAIVEAEQIFSNLLAHDPDYAAAHAGLSLALIREYTHLESDPATLKRANSSAQTALKLDSHLSLANVAAGWAAEFEGNFETALDYLHLAEILDPDNILSLLGRIRIYNKLGQSDKVLVHLKYAISKYPEVWELYSYYGQYALSQNDFQQAENMFRQAIDLSPNNSRLYAQLSYSQHLQGQTREAIQTLQDGLEIHETALLYNNLGTYLFFLGHYDIAAEAFEKTLSITGNSHDYLYWANLGDAYRFVPGKRQQSEGAYKRAIQLLSDELKREPNNSTYISRLALYLAKQNDFDQSRYELSRLDLSQNVSADIYYRAVVINELMSERKIALIMLKKALDAGYPIVLIENDPELKLLREDMQFHQLIAQTREEYDQPR